MIFKDSTGNAKAAAICLLLSASLFTLCSCKAAGKKQLINYAEQNYGDCEFISQDHNGEGNNESRTVYLRDKETGIEYSVTSDMHALDIDGSIFGYTADKSSDFPLKYRDYILDLAKDDIKDLKYKYGFDYENDHGANKIVFSARVSSDDARKAAVSFDDIIKKYDTKSLFPEEYLVYAETRIYVGFYNAVTREWESSSEYEVIDYVHRNYDPGAVFKSSMGCYINQFLSYDEVERLFPGHEDTPGGTAYYFSDSSGNLFVAIKMEDFGGTAKGIRLFIDNSYGMEEIYI